MRFVSPQLFIPKKPRRPSTGPLLVQRHRPIHPGRTQWAGIPTEVHRRRQACLTVWTGRGRRNRLELWPFDRARHCSRLYGKNGKILDKNRHFRWEKQGRRSRSSHNIWRKLQYERVFRNLQSTNFSRKVEISCDKQYTHRTRVLWKSRTTILIHLFVCPKRVCIFVCTSRVLPVKIRSFHLQRHTLP